MQSSSLPTEIKLFFDSPWAKSMVVRGNPGTGKTAFALTVSSEFAKNGEKVIYASAIASERQIRNQFPWVNQLSEDLLTIEGGASLPPGTGDQALPMLIFEFAERKPDLIVIDSWDGFTFQLTEEEKTKAARSVREVEREYDGKLLIVCEGKRVSPLDFTSDSVVLLDTEELEGRRVRILKIIKMRGLEVRQPRYLFTLAGARFKYISRWEWIVKPREARQKYPPADLSKDRVPTGVDGLDEILGGGWRRGSVNLFELGRGAGKSYVPFIVNPLRAFLCGGGALVSIPSGAFNPASVVDDLLVGYVCEDLRRKSAFVYPEIPRLEGEYTLFPPGTATPETYLRALRKAEHAMRSVSSNGILMWFLGLDSLETALGTHGALQIYYSVAQIVKNRGDIAFAALKEGQRLPHYLEHVADTHWKIEEVAGSYVMYGIQPPTPALGIEADYSGPLPRASVVPIV